MALDEVYQEILAVWCGNYWGRSGAHNELRSFIEELSTERKLKVARLFRDSSRVQEELSFEKPKKNALKLLTDIEATLKLEAHKQEINDIIGAVKEL